MTAFMQQLDKIPGINLYIGGIFSLRAKKALASANITHVLSVLRLGLDPELVKPFRHMCVEVDDVEDENLLEHFAATNAFIQEGLDAGGGVYVHCAMGKSRSATCVVAYLMSRHSLSPTEALERARIGRPMLEPNEGFMHQLELYHRMKYTTDIETSPVYQRWLYHREVQTSSDCGRAPEPEKIRFEDEHAKDGDNGAECELKCKKCRRILATSSYFIPHTPPPHNTPFPIALTCAHQFVDPLSWMRQELEQGRLDGRLECPKCKTNIGKYAWQGMRCSCGAWVVPGISLAKAKVDEVRLRPATDIKRGPGVGLGMPVGRADGRGLL